MFEINFSKDSLELLSKIVDVKYFSKIFNKQKLINKSEEPFITVRINVDDIEVLLNALTFSLTESGLDFKSEPNDNGLRIENLIDKLSTYIY